MTSATSTSHQDPASPAAIFERSPSREDTGASPPQRKEIKFVFEGCDAGKLRSILRVNARSVAFNKPVSRVSSLYFDSLSLKDCRDSIDGIGERAKVRLRWYDAPLPEGLCFFEVKRRTHRVMEKTRISLNSGISLEQMELGRLHSALAAVLPDDPALALANRPVATALVEYDREHFVDEETGIRLTLDYNLKTYPLMGCPVLRREFPDEFPRQVVLEAKAPPDAFEGLRRLLYPLKPPVARFSKYVVACQAMRGLTGARTGFES